MWLNDEYWLRASRFIVSLPASVRYILAPAEMNHLRGNCLPIAFSYIVDKTDCVVVIPKDDVDLLPFAWIEDKARWKSLYADEVFAAFHFSDETMGAASLGEHLPYFYEKAERVIAGQSVRSSRIDAPLSDDIGDKPYAVVAAASMTGNGGDRLIASSAVHLLKKAWPHLAIVVADGNPDRRLVANASAVVIGPGGMLYDLDRTRIDLMNLANWFRYGHLAAEYDTPLFSLGLGHQGLLSELGWKFAIDALASARLVTTRDRETASMLVERLNCPVEALPDLSVLFGEEIRALTSTTKGLVLTLCGDFRHVGYLAECLSDVLRDRRGYSLRFVIQANEDHEAWELHRDALQRLYASDIEVIDCREADPMLFCRAIACSDAVLTTRFHGLMVALMAGVDVFTLTHPGDKRERLRNEIGETPWARFRLWTRDLRDFAPVISEMMTGAHRDSARAVRFDLDRFDHLVGALASALRR